MQLLFHDDNIYIGLFYMIGLQCLRFCVTEIKYLLGGLNEQDLNISQIAPGKEEG